MDFNFSTPIWRIATHLNSDDLGIPAIQWEEIHTVYEGDDEQQAQQAVWGEIVSAEEPMLIYIYRCGDQIKMVEVL